MTNLSYKYSRKLRFPSRLHLKFLLQLSVVHIESHLKKDIKISMRTRQKEQNYCGYVCTSKIEVRKKKAKKRDCKKRSTQRNGGVKQVKAHKSNINLQRNNTPSKLEKLLTKFSVTVHNRRNTKKNYVKFLKSFFFFSKKLHSSMVSTASLSSSQERPQPDIFAPQTCPWNVTLSHPVGQSVCSQQKKRKKLSCNLITLSNPWTRLGEAKYRPGITK